jgi:hypothetical protein
MKKNKSVVVAQKLPKKTSTVAMWDLVTADIKERDKNGQKKYGVRLQSFNGRNAEIDAYQEVLDLIVYFRQMIEEKREIVEFIKSVSKPRSKFNNDWVTIKQAKTLLKKLGEE